MADPSSSGQRQDITFQQQWHYRRVDLSGYAGKAINAITLITEGYTQPGNWEIYYQDLVLVSADGTVRPIYTRQKTVSLGIDQSSGMTGVGYEANHVSGIGWWYIDGPMTYYHGDHLGSSRLMSSYHGYPTWQATFLPFGQEWSGTPSAALASPNHFKFTGAGGRPFR